MTIASNILKSAASAFFLDLKNPCVPQHNKPFEDDYIRIVTFILHLYCHLLVCTRATLQLYFTLTFYFGLTCKA